MLQRIKVQKNKMSSPKKKKRKISGKYDNSIILRALSKIKS